MEQNEDKYVHLNEEKYKKNKKILVTIAIIIAMLGILIGGGLIVAGIMKKNGANNVSALEVPQSNEVAVSENDVDELRKEVEAINNETEEKYNENAQQMDEDYNQQVQQMFDYYDQQEKQMEEYYNKNVKQMDDEHDKKVKQMNEESAGTTMIMIGIFILIASLMVAGSILTFAHRREILAFQTQQAMPVAQEGIDKITPTIANAAGAITKEVAKAKGEAIRDVAGDTAKNITKGIKEGSK